MWKLYSKKWSRSLIIISFMNNFLKWAFSFCYIWLSVLLLYFFNFQRNNGNLESHEKKNNKQTNELKADNVTLAFYSV